MRIVTLSDKDMQLLNAYGEFGGPEAARRLGYQTGYIYQRVGRIKKELIKADALIKHARKLSVMWPRLKRSFIVVVPSDTNN